MKGLLFGKGPSYDPGLVDRLQPDHVACVNEAVLHVRGPRWLVYSDQGVGVELAKNGGIALETCVGIYCPRRDRPLWNRRGDESWFTSQLILWSELYPSDGWRGISRATALTMGLCYHEGYSSTNALWWLWLLGCDRVYLSGVGDPSGYHPLFPGAPKIPTEGSQAATILRRVAAAKKIELIQA